MAKLNIFLKGYSIKIKLKKKFCYGKNKKKDQSDHLKEACLQIDCGRVRWDTSNLPNLNSEQKDANFEKMEWKSWTVQIDKDEPGSYHHPSLVKKLVGSSSPGWVVWAPPFLGMETSRLRGSGRSCCPSFWAGHSTWRHEAGSTVFILCFRFPPELSAWRLLHFTCIHQSLQLDGRERWARRRW